MLLPGQFVNHRITLQGSREEGLGLGLGLGLPVGGETGGLAFVGRRGSVPCQGLSLLLKGQDLFEKKACAWAGLPASARARGQ